MVIVRTSVLALVFNSACYLQQLRKHVLVHPFVCTSVCVSVLCVRNPLIPHDWGLEGTLHGVPSCKCCVCSPHYASAVITNTYAQAHWGANNTHHRINVDLYKKVLLCVAWVYLCLCMRGICAFPSVFVFSFVSVLPAVKKSKVWSLQSHQIMRLIRTHL